VERLGQAMDGLGLFYDRRCRYQEGESTFRLAAEKLGRWTGGPSDGDPGSLPDVARLIYARALTWQAYFSALGRTGQAGDLLSRSLDLLDALASVDTRRERAWTLLLVGGWEVFLGNQERAWQPYEQALALFRALDRRWDMAETLDLMARTATMQGEGERAKALCQEALALRRALGDRWGLVESLGILGTAFRSLGQFEEGERVGREELAIARELGERALIGQGLRHVAHALTWKGEFVESRLLAEEGLRICHDLGARHSATYNLRHVLGWTMAHLGRYKEARVHAQQALALLQDSANRWAAIFCLLILGLVAWAEDNHAEAWQYLREGSAVARASGLQHMMGLTLAALAGAARELGRRALARELLCEALEICSAIRSGPAPLIALPVAALVLADLGETERAVEIYACASRYPHVARSRLWEDVAGRQIAALAATLSPEVVAAAQARGRARDRDATIDELAVELRVDEPVP
jgi:tetratricopeptide (TPR) repeat protein